VDAGSPLYPPLVRILWYPARSGPRDCDYLRCLLPALRTAQPRRQGTERRRPAYQARQGLRLNVTRGSARAAHAYQELPEAVVQLLDVSKYPHPRMVRTTADARPCSTAAGRLLDIGRWTGDHVSE
jgi:hypothetical protein